MTQTTIDRRAKVAAEFRAELARQSILVPELVRGLAKAGTPISAATLYRRLSGELPFYFWELEAIASFLGRPLTQFTEASDAA